MSLSLLPSGDVGPWTIVFELQEDARGPRETPTHGNTATQKSPRTSCC